MNIKNHALGHIPALFHRVVNSAVMHNWPSGGFAAPLINGRYVVNLMPRQVTLCGTDGIKYAVPAMTENTKSLLLIQLYHALGVSPKHIQQPAFSMRGTKAMILEPIPVYASRYNKPVAFNREVFKEVSEWSHPETFITQESNYFRSPICPVPDFFNDTIRDTRVTDETEWQNACIRKANDICAVNSLARALKEGTNGLFFLSTLNEGELKYDSWGNTPISYKVLNHVSFGSDNVDYLKSNISLNDPSAQATDAEAILRNGTPILLWDFVTERELEQSNRGHYLAGLGTTVSTRNNIVNKALSFTTNELDCSVAQMGIRIVVPRRVGKEECIYARLGDVVLRAISVPSQNSGNTAYALMTNESGEEGTVGTAMVDELFTKGMTIHTEYGESIIKFFETEQEARGDKSPELLAAEAKADTEIKALGKQLLEQEKELTRFRKEEEVRKESKNKTVVSYIVNFLKDATVQKALVGAVVTIATLAWGFIKGVL